MYRRHFPQGGIRTTSFVSGGFVPAHRRGTRWEGLVAAWDWYATLCALAGVKATDGRAAAARLPVSQSPGGWGHGGRRGVCYDCSLCSRWQPVDSVDMSEALFGAGNAKPRTTLLIGTGCRPHAPLVRPLSTRATSQAVAHQHLHRAALLVFSRPPRGE